MNNLPDYFQGRLIYELDDGDACRWVVYDGDKMQRFPTRKKAEKWCTEHSKKVSREELEILILATTRLTSSYQNLDRVAPKFVEEREVIEGLALALRQVADKLDTIISRHV